MDSANHHLKLDFSHSVRERSQNRCECREPLFQPSAQSKVGAVVRPSAQGFVQLGLEAPKHRYVKNLAGKPRLCQTILVRKGSGLQHELPSFSGYHVPAGGEGLL